VLSGSGGPEPALVVGRAKALALDLKALLPALLEAARGKGGGSPDQLQIAAADAASARAAWELARTHLETHTPRAT